MEKTVRLKEKKLISSELNIKELIPFVSLILVFVFFQIITDGTLLSLRNL